MNIRRTSAVATALLGVALVAQAGTSGDVQPVAARAAQEPSRIEAAQERLEAALAEQQAKLEERIARAAQLRRELEARLAEKRQAITVELQEKYAERMAQEQERWARELALAEAMRVPGFPQQVYWATEGGAGWVGITIEEVTADRVKELKLPAERGAYIREVASDSPASKSGLKAGDVVTEFNGQRIESAAQLIRMVRETPAGRTVQLTVWRDGRAQQISVELGDSNERIRTQIQDRLRIIEPRNFTFNMPRMELFASPTPLLGIQADDLTGQLGTYFGAPDGEGVLVREVNSGSPAEKAGLKAGDVITKVDGARVRTTSELRSELREKRDKDAVNLSVLRNRAETTVKVEIEKPKPPESRRSRAISRKVST